MTAQRRAKTKREKSIRAVQLTTVCEVVTERGIVHALPGDWLVLPQKGDFLHFTSTELRKHGKLAARVKQTTLRNP
jgi:hypothetical protein